MTVEKGFHCAYQTHYRIVFPVKYRKALLSKPVEEYILWIVEQPEERYDVVFERVGCDVNHIHILCSFHPKWSIGQVVRMFKSIVGKELFKKFPEIRKDLWG